MSSNLTHLPEPAAAVPELPHDCIALLPMRNVVLFPHVITPLSVGRTRSLAAVELSLKHSSATHLQGGLIGVILQRKAEIEDPQTQDLFSIGTVARILRHSASEHGGQHLICQGLQRFRTIELVPGWPCLVARIERLSDGDVTTAVEAAGLALRQRAVALLELLPSVPAEVLHVLQSTHSPLQLGNVVAGLLDVSMEDKQRLLENRDAADRLTQLLKRVEHRIEVLRLSQEMGLRTREHLEDRERKYLLREQLNTIRKELGEDDSPSQLQSQFEQAITQSGMPQATATEARRELQRLGHLSESSSEHGILRTWLEWLTELPWQVPVSQAMDLEQAQATLEADHFGLEKVKRSIIEFLAVRQLNPNGRAPILCFVGPPGVGKTSLGQSIAKALGRPFARVALGGVHDESEIRGHRRTYIGAMPGCIIQAIRRSGARDGVLMLDEIDKLSASFHGDPTAALLEVLDPAQNSTFSDHYLGVPFDLSRILFIATANVLDTISAPLRDRLDVMELSGYTAQEKLEIAQRYLLDRQREVCGLKKTQCDVRKEALSALIAGYTREAGVRQLEREIGRLMRHAALQIAKGRVTELAIHAVDLERILGAPRFEPEPPLRSNLTGVATGLAWTPVGGDILIIEVSRVAGTGRLILTGQLGEVMRESAQAALTWVKTHAHTWHLPASQFEAVDVHVHVPAGAIPKDGPSAGVAMLVALASLFSERPVQHDTAMTGEISLRGLVLPVGGIREKVLAAQRAGLKKVLLPERNRRDLEDIPGEVQTQLELIWLKTAEDALRYALEAKPVRPLAEFKRT
jgi:ATP-dependent Lon protease